MALKLVKSGPGVFHVRGGELLPANACTWTTWKSGRIYPPAGTYWVEFIPGVHIEKRGSETVKLTGPALVTVGTDDLLLLLYMQDGQAVRITPV